MPAGGKPDVKKSSVLVNIGIEKGLHNICAERSLPHPAFYFGRAGLIPPRDPGQVACGMVEDGADPVIVPGAVADRCTDALCYAP
jgi:hypothetical protein